MKKSYNSFEEIFSESKAISGIISDTNYKAHTPGNVINKAKELLSTHINLVNDYARLLITENNIDETVDRCLTELLFEFPNKLAIGNLVKEFFATTIIFHDFGKINPNFQYEKMAEVKTFSYDKSIKIDSQHSKLSAHIYVNFHAQIIDGLKSYTDTERCFLYLMSSVFSSCILRHHSSYIDYYIEFKANELLSIKKFLNYFSLKDCGDNFFSMESLNLLMEDCQDLEFMNNPLIIYTLIKLNFSLLTTSDYYATNEYMNDFPVQEFGLLDEKRKLELYNQYWNYDYNQKTKLNWGIIKKTTFEQLQERNNSNLNVLRSKLLIEGVESVREQTEGNLFYLEAPTGSGKTNLSLAIALELLLVDDSLNKIFYVFPFTALVEQTFDVIKKTLGLTNDDIIQLHSKSGFHSQRNNVDGEYGGEQINYMNNLFLNYPVTLLTHIKFFDILKGNDKENTYIFHRIANSVVIIDELQSYNPKHWDKMAWMLSEYGRLFNIKFVLMSATLPKIDEADKTIKIPFRRLIKNRNCFFQNPNFCDRVTFDFSLLNWEKATDKEGKGEYLVKLAEFVKLKSENYADRNGGSIKTIIEFIKKKSANEFYLKATDLFIGYEIYLLSGEILDPRRKFVIAKIKENKEKKILLITTQVVEAGVDIDMDLGFKDRSIIDSDEQLAGRVNRNASKENSFVYIFDYDDEAHVYRNDERRKVVKEKSFTDEHYQSILKTKDFDKLYKLVFDKINKKNNNAYQNENLNKYKAHFGRFDFREIKDKFRLIEDGTQSVFVPIKIPTADLDEEFTKTAILFGIAVSEFISGKDIFEKYVAIATDKDLRNKIMEYKTSLKKIYGLISRFTFSVYDNAARAIIEKGWTDKGSENNYTERFGMLYLNLEHYEFVGKEIYSYVGGINVEEIGSSGEFL